MELEEQIVVADTGFVVALLNRTNTFHQAAASVYPEVGKILLPQTVLSETAYLWLPS